MNPIVELKKYAKQLDIKNYKDLWKIVKKLDFNHPFRQEVELLFLKIELNNTCK